MSAAILVPPDAGTALLTWYDILVTIVILFIRVLLTRAWAVRTAATLPNRSHGGPVMFIWGSCLNSRGGREYRRH